MSVIPPDASGCLGATKLQSRARKDDFGINDEESEISEVTEDDDAADVVLVASGQSVNDGASTDGGACACSGIGASSTTECTPGS